MEVLKRIMKIQNSKGQLSWGVCELDPPVKCSEEFLKPREQYVLVCGHSYYRKIKTLILEIYHNDTIGVFVENEEHKFDCILAYGAINIVIEKIIQSLKDWFPAKVV